MPEYKIEDLNQNYDDAKHADRMIYAEMRSNILLSAGEHFTKKNTVWWNRIRTSTEVNDSQKMRITKNWIHKYLRLYTNSIFSKAPGATCKPANDTELQDQKSAELNNKVLKYSKRKYKWKSIIRRQVDDYCRIGEVCMKIFWDPDKGDVKGYEALVSETGEPLFDEMGQPVPDESKPILAGGFTFERIFGYQLFRDQHAKDMKESAWLGVEKLYPLKMMKARYANDPEKLKMLVESHDEFVVFDSSKLSYSREKDQVSIREFYWRKCKEYPEGYYYITTESGILHEGPLPFGVFPLFWAGFDEHPSTPRATGFIRVVRPWAAEVNRASSQIALHQVTLSDDKVLYQTGSKVAQGALLPGVRGITYQGQPPTILPGRTGQQYYEYVDRQVQEMEDVLLIDEISKDKVANMDPQTLLYRTMKQESYFSEYSDKFGDFLVDWHEGFLELAKNYMEDEELIEAIGKDEFGNIAELKNKKNQYYQIEVEQGSETIETKLGRHMTTIQTLQYVGKQMEREDIGKLLVNLPFGNWEDSFGDMMINEKNAKNDMLAMERGEMPPINSRDDSEYNLKAIGKRKKERDFRMLSEQVQMLYQKYEQIHLMKIKKEAEDIKKAQSEFIPTDGAMVGVDMYLPQDDPEKAPKRARIPYGAVEWLVQQLESQGRSLETLENMNQGQMAQLAGSLTGGGQLPGPQQRQPY